MLHPAAHPMQFVFEVLCLGIRILGQEKTSSGIDCFLFQHRTDPGFEGHDMNAVGAWKRGYTGKGVVVSILDDGRQLSYMIRHGYIMGVLSS